MRRIESHSVADAVARLAVDACCVLGDDLVSALEAAATEEESPLGKEILAQLLENARIGKEERVPVCQDTGVAVVFVSLGSQVEIVGSDLVAAIQEGVRRGYEAGFLRKSIVRSPLDRVNTRDNTPAVVHIESVPGDKIVLHFMAKGAGCENMSRIAMLPPSAGRDGVIEFVVDTVSKAGGNPCPPIVVGVGLGGTFEMATLLSKKSLLRRIGVPNLDPATAALERDILERINRLGLGPMGLGGRVTALAVSVETHPCHIASLPVAVNIDCHAHRHKALTL